MFGSMEGQTGRAKDITADATGFRMWFAQINPTVRTLRAGIFSGVAGVSRVTATMLNVMSH